MKLYANFPWDEVYTETHNHSIVVDYRLTQDYEPAPKGFYRVEVVNEKPTLTDKQKLVYHTWKENGVIKKEYLAYDKDAELPEIKPIRTFSKLKLVAALMQANLWAQVKSWVEFNGLYDLYLAAQVVTEDNEYFTQGLATLKADLQLTDEQVEGILAQCVAD